MSFKSLHHVLGGLQNQYQRQEQNQLQRVLQCWADIVGPVVAVQTRPLSIYRGILKVTTSSAAWAQNLVFERQRILDKLNHSAFLHDTEQITDIRFSPAQWQETPVTSFPGDQLQHQLWQEHPSRFAGGESSNTAPGSPQNRLRRGSPAQQLEPLDPQKLAVPKSERKTSEDAIVAFRQWSAQMKVRSRQLPLCPECQCPAPLGELDRWSVCAICAAKRWS